jgi:hypothetical protein
VVWDILLASALGLVQLAFGFLGFRVTLRPPEARLHRQYKWAFGVLSLIGLSLVIVIAARNGLVQSSVNAKLDELNQAVEALTKPLPAVSPSKSLRDPDGIYQNGRLAGTVVDPRITVNQSKVYFEKITNAKDLDRTKPFQYRDFILRMTNIGGYVGMLISPSGVEAGVYQNVVCEIIDRVGP